MKFSIRLTLILIACLTFQKVLGQDGIVIKGILKDQETLETITNGIVIVKANGTDIDTVMTDEFGKFHLSLRLGKTYYLHFSNNGYISKNYLIETEKVPLFGEGLDYYILEIPVFINKMIEGFNIEIMNDPVGLIYYGYSANTFIYDVNYANGMKAKISAEFERLKKIESEKEKLKIELDSLTNRGDDYMAEKKYNDALNVYSDALQLSPGDEKIQRKINEAKQANERTVYPIEIEKQFELYISKADSAMQSKKWKAAKKYYSKALKIKPEESLPKEKIQEIDRVLSETKN